MTKPTRETTDMTTSSRQDLFAGKSVTIRPPGCFGGLFFALLLPTGIRPCDYRAYLIVNSDEIRLPLGQKNVTSSMRFSPAAWSSGNVNS